MPSNSELDDFIARYDRYQNCDEYHIHYGSHADAIPLEEHQGYDEGALKADLLVWCDRYTERKVVEVLKSLKQDMRMHTVPEGPGLITRSYLENTIDFKISQCSAPNTNGGEENV